MANANLVIKKKGGAEMIFGAVLVLMPLVLLPYRPVATASFAAGDYIIRLVFMATFLLGMRLLVRGIHKRSLHQTLLRMQNLFADSRRVPLSMVTGLLGCSLTRLVADVRAMHKAGLTQGLHADLSRGELVVTGEAPATGILGKIFGSKPEAAPPPPQNDGTILREEQRRSTAPIYTFAVVWAAYALFFPFYRPLDLAIALILAVIAYLHTAWSTPPRIVIVEVPPIVPMPIMTGNELLDEMLHGVDAQLDTLRRLESAIDGQIALRVRDILRTTEQIIEQLKKTPDKARDMRQFFNYTLPTTLNLLQNYEEMRASPVQGQNIAAATTKIEGMMCKITDAFHRQLDALYADKALDIAVELEVMDKVINQDGGIKSMYNDYNK